MYVSLSVEALCAQMVFLSTRIPVSSLCINGSLMSASLIYFTGSATFSAQSDTIDDIVPVLMGTPNTPLNISWVRLMLTMPTVFNETVSACMFDPYCIVLLIPSGKRPANIDLDMGHTTSTLWCAVVVVFILMSIS